MKISKNAANKIRRLQNKIAILELDLSVRNEAYYNLGTMLDRIYDDWFTTKEDAEPEKAKAMFERLESELTQAAIVDETIYHLWNERRWALRRSQRKARTVKEGSK